jgi:hypothetical protein
MMTCTLEEQSQDKHVYGSYRNISLIVLTIIYLFICSKMSTWKIKAIVITVFLAISLEESTAGTLS